MLSEPVTKAKSSPAEPRMAPASTNALSEALNFGEQVRQLRALSAELNGATSVVQLAKAKQAPLKAVKKKTGWTKAKAKRYRQHLIRRGTFRAEHRGKPTGTLVRKAANAKRLADSKFKGLRLADPPTAGHHVPALALANKRTGTFPFGERGSAQEKQRQRLYFEGTSDERSHAHGIIHEAETFAGLGDRNSANYPGTDANLARLQTIAHTGLTLDSGGSIGVRLRPQSGASGPGPLLDPAAATAQIFEEDHGITVDTSTFGDEDTDSEPESDEARWFTDSEDEAG